MSTERKQIGETKKALYSKSRTRSVLILSTAQGLREIFKKQVCSTLDESGPMEKHSMSVGSAYRASLGSVSHAEEEKGETLLLPYPLERNVHKESYILLAEASQFGALLWGMVSIPLFRKPGIMKG